MIDLRDMLVIAVVAATGGCRGQVARDPPVHLNLNMDFQERFEPQSKNAFFKDQRAMRPEVPGTVAVGQQGEDDHLERGIVDGRPALALPRGLELRRPLLERGRERYGIFCTPCHDAAGTGEGIVVKKGMLPPPRFTDRRLLAMPIGQLYQVISRGVRNMPSYAAQIPVADRWAIAAYVRALQIAQRAKLGDIPADVRQQQGWRP
jgi:mono/diheme cytochrome c family protein